MEFAAKRTETFAETKSTTHTLITATLISFIAVASFWSTAAVEIGAILLVLNAMQFGAVSSIVRFSSTDKRPLLPLRTRWALGLWAIYMVGVLISFPANGVPFSRHPGLLWHPLLFPAVLFISMDREQLNRIGIYFLASGACCSGVVLLRNFNSIGANHAMAGFAGVTTFADLLVLAAVVAMVALSTLPLSLKFVLIIAISGLVAVFTLLETLELASIIALFVAGTIIVLTQSARMKLGWISLVAAVVLVGPSIPLLKIGWLIHGHSIDRYIVWKEGFRLLPKAPVFGYGPECYRRVLPPETWAKFANKPPGAWHNDVLETALDSGLITSVAFIALILVVLYYSTGQAWSRSKGRREKTDLALNLMLLCMAGFGLVGNVITTSILGMVFWLVMGLNLQSAFYALPSEAELQPNLQGRPVAESSLAG